MPCTTKMVFILLSLTLAFFSAPRASAGVIYYAYGDNEITSLGSNLSNLAVDISQQYLTPCCQIENVFWNGTGYYTYLNGYIASLGSNLSNLAFDSSQQYLAPPGVYIEDVFAVETGTAPEPSSLVMLLSSLVVGLAVRSHYRLGPAGRASNTGPDRFKTARDGGSKRMG